MRVSTLYRCNMNKFLHQRTVTCVASSQRGEEGRREEMTRIKEALNIQLYSPHTLLGTPDTCKPLYLSKSSTSLIRNGPQVISSPSLILLPLHITYIHQHYFFSYYQYYYSSLHNNNITIYHEKFYFITILRKRREKITSMRKYKGH